MRWIAMIGIAVSFVAFTWNSPGADEPRRIPVQTDTLGKTHELIGPLGRPLGEMLTITARVEPTRIAKGRFSHYVAVLSVNGASLPNPRILPYEMWSWANLKALPLDRQLTLRVYQDGGMMGMPYEAMQETVVVQSEAHHFATWLVIVNEVLAPAQ